MNLYKRFYAGLQKKWRDEEESPESKEFKLRYFTKLTGTVLELGAGAGTNLKYLPKDIHWIGIEPNEVINESLRSEASKYGITNIEIKNGKGEQLPLADSSCDAVIATFVLCSVDNQQQVLSEIKRVLKPGSKYFFMEHVAAPKGTWLCWYQNFINPFNKIWTNNCNVNRETLATIKNSGFKNVSATEANIMMTIAPWPHIWGVAEK